ncbi:unnamed protein product [Mytilus coruscus]|uniref:Fibrinogen C-terminal domain-containing protein n=1 Tax=Mytilus coruscus TaxID=42192 RepID=A0A6J8CR23_MYTCO|nr:unnamed protein product [Mytilus coruscus]
MQFPHGKWIELMSHREMALAKRHSREHEHTHHLPPLQVGDHVYIQNLEGNHPMRWEHTGSVVESTLPLVPKIIFPSSPPRFQSTSCVEWNTDYSTFSNTGNQKLHTLTEQEKCELRVDISDFNGRKAYVKYSTFAVGNALTKYKLTVTGYSGNAVLSLITGNSLDYHNDQAFTTKDMDNDSWRNVSCGINREGAWWYNQCAYANLNGVYMEGGKSNEKGIQCYHWNNTHYSMKSFSRMIRRL